MTTSPSDDTLARIKELLAQATYGPWCYESCGEKGDGANVIGVAFPAADESCTSPLAGKLEPYDDQGNEIEYYRDEEVAVLEHRNRNPSNDAELICALRNNAEALISRLEAAEARAAAAEAACVDARRALGLALLADGLCDEIKARLKIAWLKVGGSNARAALTINSGTEMDTRSTLKRSIETERDYYLLRAQEWAVDPETVERLILASELPCRQKYCAALTANPKDTGGGGGERKQTWAAS